MIGILYLLPVDPLSDVLSLLELEDELNEVLLQLLVGVVDAELFEPADTSGKMKLQPPRS